MALSFTVSYTFSPSTTISSSQVNTNTSDVALVFQGLEDKTKSFSNLKVDTSPASATEVAIKSYVDSLMTWRRPVLKYGSATTVSVESGLDGTSGDIPMVFPDGSYRTETSTTRTTFDITRNAVLTTSGAQSGLTGATSEAPNTWYALYACKVTDSSTLWCTVGSTVLPLRANYATLNAAYGTSGWVYLGMVRNGDNGAATNDILNFVQCGNTTIFLNTNTGATVTNTGGTLLATGSAETSLTYTLSRGTGTAQIPDHFSLFLFQVMSTNPAAGTYNVRDSSDSAMFLQSIGTSPYGNRLWSSTGVRINHSSTANDDILLAGWIDGVLGVGANPLL